MIEDLSMEQKQLIVDAGHDSHKHLMMEIENPDLLVFLMDSAAFDRILQELLMEETVTLN